MAKTIDIRVNLSSNCATVDDPKKHGHHKDAFRWYCNDASTLDIYFNKNGWPFSNGSHFHATGNDYTKPSAIVRDDASEGVPYDYQITVTDVRGNVCSVDPQVIIDSDQIDWTLVLAVLTGLGLLTLGFLKFFKEKKERQ